MKVLFAVNDESVSDSIIKRYQKDYKEIISSKNVYYYNAIIKELQKDKSYDRIIIGEDLEPFSSDDYASIDKFLFDKLDKISDEAYNTVGNDIPIILVCTDRRTRPEPILVKLFGIGIYNALIGQDRSIDEVCKLIKKPRSKKEAKAYYRIDSDNVEYRQENESDVSEAEIQNILAHYKKLGKNEEKYVTSFESIVSQYSDEQLKLIINFFPANVQKVLEQRSNKYRELIGLSPIVEIKNSKDNNNSGINILDNKTSKNQLSSPVIIPGTVNTQNVKKVIDETTKIQEEKIEDNGENIENKEKKTVKKVAKTSKKGTKVEHEVEQSEVDVKPTKRRGRPPKAKKEESEIEVQAEFKEEKSSKEGKSTLKKDKRSNKKEKEEKNKVEKYDALPGFEDLDDVVIIPEIDEDLDNEIEIPEIDENLDDEIEMPGMDEELEDDEIEMPGMNEELDDNEIEMPEINARPKVDEIEVPEKEDDEDEFSISDNIENSGVETSKIDDDTSSFNGPIKNVNFNSNTSGNINNSIQNRSYLNSQMNVNIDSLLTSNKKIVSFVGTTKNGTSFIVNNIAQILSEKGIKTAILDLTQNRNAYYVYTDNRDDLRNIAFKCIQNLKNGIPEGIEINKNLTVYTSLPEDIEELKDSQIIIETLLNNYSLILLDCDFATDYSYFNISQEMYLVQSLDVLTIQPLTAFLRELKAKNILEPNKLRVIINKYVKSQITNKMLIGGISSYNDPSMSYMTELFNKDKMKYLTIPFEIQNYSKYLESLVNCKISLKGYSKNFIKSLNELASNVFPLLGNGNTYIGYSSNFSKKTNDTLNKMKSKI